MFYHVTKQLLEIYTFSDSNAKESELWIWKYECYAKNIVQENTCFNNALNPNCSDLFIPNHTLSFQNRVTTSAGLSDFHKVVVTVMGMTFEKHSSIGRHYRGYKYFDEIIFKNDFEKN